MAKNEKKPIHERIEDLKKQIVATTDKHQVKKLLDQLLTLQRRADVVPSELTIPVSEIQDELDFGAYSIKRTIRGILFTCKGGFSTFVESRMTAVYGMLNQMLEICKNPSEDPERKEMEDAFCSACVYIFQAPIFGSLKETILFDTAATLLKNFNEFTAEYYTNAKVAEETEDDIKANNEFVAMGEAMETIANAQIPPEI